MGNDVVTYSDDNYCRGRILKEINNGNSYEVRLLIFLNFFFNLNCSQILLFDFGVKVERESSKVFKLEDKWMNQQAANYRGRLTVEQENNKYNSKDKLYGKTKDQFVDAEISKIDRGVAEIILID